MLPLEPPAACSSSTVTAMPDNTWVVPRPAVRGGPRMPGKSGLEPEALALGSMMSNTGPARQSSPGAANSKATSLSASSSSNSPRSSSLSMSSVSPSSRVEGPDRRARTGWYASVRFTR